MKMDARDHEFRFSQGVYERLLLAYPARHRAAYGAAMAQLFRDQCRDAWTEAQAWGLLKLWRRILPDLASTSVRERLAALKERKTMTEKLASLFAFRIAPISAFFRLFALVFLAVFLASVVITFILPESYASTARIRVEPDAPVAGGPSPAYVPYDPYFVQTTFEIMQSQRVLEPVVDKLKLNAVWGKKYYAGQTLQTADTIEILKQRLQLAPVKNTTLIAITVYSDNKSEAAQIADAVAESYQQYREASRAELAAQGLKVLSDQSAVQEQQIRESQAALVDLQKKYQISENSKPTTDTQPYWEAKQNLEQLVASHQLLLAKIEEQKLDMHLPKSSLAQITDLAVPGRAPVRPNKTVDIILGAIAGIFLATTIAGALALWSALIGTRARKAAVPV